MERNRPMDTEDDLGAATVARSVQVLTAISMMAENLARIRQQRANLRADRDFAAAASRRAEHLAEHGAARAVYGQTGDRQWGSRTTVVGAAHTWRVAQRWADLDPAAAMAQRRAEDVLRAHNPTAMARYDVLRAKGADELGAMREAAPLFLAQPSTPAGLPDAVAARAEAGAERAQGDRDRATPDIVVTAADEATIAAHNAARRHGVAEHAEAQVDAPGVAQQAYPATPSAERWHRIPGTAMHARQPVRPAARQVLR
jgi:hypothetical protein